MVAIAHTASPPHPSGWMKTALHAPWNGCRNTWSEVTAVWGELVNLDDPPEGLTETTRLYRYVTVTLYLLVMLCMVGIGGVVLVLAAVRPFHGRLPLQVKVSTSLGGLILAVIIFELLETVFKQLAEGERLSVGLVNNFLIIGAVSAVRHILVIGALLSDSERVTGNRVTEHANEINQLFANVVLVAVLLAGIWLIRGMVVYDARLRAAVRDDKSPAR